MNDLKSKKYTRQGSPSPFFVQKDSTSNSDKAKGNKFSFIDAVLFIMLIIGISIMENGCSKVSGSLLSRASHVYEGGVLVLIAVGMWILRWILRKV